jgi:hypothetical protein
MSLETAAKIWDAPWFLSICNKSSRSLSSAGGEHIQWNDSCKHGREVCDIRGIDGTFVEAQHRKVRKVAVETLAESIAHSKAILSAIGGKQLGRGGKLRWH